MRRTRGVDESWRDVDVWHDRSDKERYQVVQRMEPADRGGWEAESAPMVGVRRMTGSRPGVQGRRDRGQKSIAQDWEGRWPRGAERDDRPGEPLLARLSRLALVLPAVRDRLLVSDESVLAREGLVALFAPEAVGCAAGLSSAEGAGRCQTVDRLLVSLEVVEADERR